MWNPHKPACVQLTEQIQLWEVDCSTGKYDSLCRENDIWKDDCKIFAYFKLSRLDQNAHILFEQGTSASMFENFALMEYNNGHPYHFIKFQKPKF